MFDSVPDGNWVLVIKIQIWLLNILEKQQKDGANYFLTEFFVVNAAEVRGVYFCS